MASVDRKSRQEIADFHRYKNRRHLNIGIILYIAIFLYMIIYVMASTKTTRISPYEVKEGSLATNYTYRGIAIRDEQLITSDKAGYINYYVKEGTRVACGDLVYTVDETGRLAEYLENISLDENTLSDTELSELRSQIAEYMKDFEETNFATTYDFKSGMQHSVLKLENTAVMEGIKAITGENGTRDLIDYHYSPNTGIITYKVDGYEELTPASITMEYFDEAKYEENQLFSNELITAGDTIFRLSTNENWSIMVPIEEVYGQELVAEEYVKVRFIRNGYESWAQTGMVHGADGNTYLQLDFNNSMITFANDRFIDFELVLHEETGLKIPNSAIVNREFFIVPEEYLTKGGDNNKDGVIRESYNEDGTIYSEFVETEIYSHDESSGEYYLDTTVLQLGDKLYKPASQETYTVSRKASLIGVYNMNKGYADFRQINILYQNDEYAIVKSNTQYGLNVYDYIVLDASAVSDEQFIYD
ncbi:MAG: hypothetical protein IJZ82_11085 [Lachnospiraceae bacterium]|nr:hypothetical protein [Lachnospiraceae bacterium]